MEALAIAREKLPAAVVLEVVLPDMTGYDVTDSAGFIKLFGLPLRGRKRLAPMDVEKAAHQ